MSVCLRVRVSFSLSLPVASSRTKSTVCFLYVSARDNRVSREGGVCSGKVMVTLSKNTDLRISPLLPCVCVCVCVRVCARASLSLSVTSSRSKPTFCSLYVSARDNRVTHEWQLSVAG